jgi:S-layer homology domain
LSQRLAKALFVVGLALPAAVARAEAGPSTPAPAAAASPATSSPTPSTPPPARARPAFSDVPPNHWAYDAVNELAALGILVGYPAPPPPAPRANRARPARPARGAAPHRPAPRHR